MFINNFDPVAFNFFSLEIRWYSLAYIFGIIIGWFYCKKYLIKDRHEKLFRSVVKDLQKAIDGFKSNTSLELVAEDLKMAQRELSLITGSVSSDELLGEIFSSFCIGK